MNTLVRRLLSVCLLPMMLALVSAAQTAPGISSVSLSKGPVGMGFIVTGSNFGATQGNSAVLLNGVALTVVAWSDTSITVQLPPGASSGSVVVQVSGNASNGLGFTVTATFGCS